MINYTCHSGGCPGADMTWETVGHEFGVKTIAYSFQGHKQYGENQKILTVKELEEGFDMVMRANKNLKRYPQGQPTYVKNLLARNWFQVKNSEAVFAIGKLDGPSKVSGGTGWAVQMAIDSKKPVYIFNQPTNAWYSGENYDSEGMGFFVEIDHIPVLTENFAGIGTREIDDNGINAIMNIYKNNCEKA